MKAMGSHKSNLIFQFLIFGILTLPLFSQTWIPLDEIEGPLCVALNEESGEPFPLSPKNSRYNVVITDGFAKIELTQTFVNDIGKLNELVFVFPLPHEGSVHGMTMQYQDSIYEAKIYEKTQAESLYNNAVDLGLVAALLVQNKPNIFTQKIAHIQFGDTAYIRTVVSMPLNFSDGEYELVVPTMIADRYLGYTNPGSQGNVWNPPADRDGQTLQFNVLFQTGFPIDNIGSPTHPLFFSNLDAQQESLEAQGLIDEGTQVIGSNPIVATLATYDTYPNKDYVLRFKRSEKIQDFTLASYWDKDRKEGTFALQLFPDDQIYAGDRADLELVILMDVSGSQGGWPIQKEKEIVHTLLDRVHDSDNIILLTFSNSQRWAFPKGQAVPATSENIATAREFIDGSFAGGGTELLSAIQTTLAIPLESERQRVYVFLTDGFIGNEETIFELVENHPTKPTIFTFGAGDNLNRYFLDRTAELGNGVSFEVTGYESVEPFVNSAWEKLASPQLTNISFSFSGADIHSLIKPVSSRLYKGQAYVMYGKYKSGGPLSLTLNAYKEGQPFQLHKNLKFDAVGTVNEVVPFLWARQKIRELSLEQGTTDSNKATIIDVSTEYQVLSKYTAFLALNPVSVDDYQGDPIFTSIHDRGDENNLDKLGLLAHIKLSIHLNSIRILLPQGVWMQKMEVYDLKGKLVYVYQNSASTETGNSGAPSTFIWDGKRMSGGALEKGHYIIKMTTNRGVEVRRIYWNP